MAIEEVEEKIGYKFFDKDLLRRALTSKDFAEKQKQQNQDYEHQELLSTLGDAVWKLVVTHRLTPDCETKGKLTKKRIELEQHSAQVKIAQNLGIELFIQMSDGERKDKNKENILEATIEALAGAIFLDTGNYEVTKDVIIKWFNVA
jgi:ribonuclease-3